MRKLELIEIPLLLDFRKQFIKEKYIMYLNYKILEEAISKNQIFGDFENEKLTKYVVSLKVVTNF